MTSLADVFVDSADLPGNPENARAALTEAVTEQTRTEAPPEKKTATDEYQLPEKFKGKSVKDIVEAYIHLESVNGRMANDLGTQRQLTDRLLDLKRSEDLGKNASPATAKPAPVTASDLLDRPQETLERVLDANNARVTEDVNARLTRMEASLAQQTFTTRHPDFQTVVKDAKFASWVQASPIRLRAAAAANAGNWQIADELLSEFKAGNPSATTVTTETKQELTADLEGARKASLETSGSTGEIKTTGGGKVYRRADLMRLRINDPEAYYEQSFQDEILKAHAEGRVK